MHFKTFSRIAFFFLAIATSWTLYLILFNEPSDAEKRRIANFSNITFSKINNIQIKGRGPITKNFHFNYNNRAYHIDLLANNSTITADEENNAIVARENLFDCTITLQEQKALNEIGFRDIQLNCESSTLDYTNTLAILKNTSVEGSYISANNGSEPFKMQMQNCRIGAHKSDFVIADHIILTSERLNLVATKALLDLKNQKLLCFGSKNEKVTFLDKRHNTCYTTKQCTLDFSKGLSHTSISSDAVVSCSTNNFINPLTKKTNNEKRAAKD